MKLKELGEFNLIERIREKTPQGSGVRCGIGDDAAVLSLPKGHQLLTSTDMLIEGIHFRHDWISPKDLGHKAVAVNLSDIAAMGGTPRFLYLGLACPGDTEVDLISSFLEGVLTEAGEHGVALVGGDTCRSPGPWIISVTVEGSAEETKIVQRQGACPGDLVMVSGPLGDSALALHKLQTGDPLPPALAIKHFRPKARVAFGQRLAQEQLANAMIDISDGLVADLEHILQASTVDAVIDLDDVPRSEAFKQHVNTASDLDELALFGGEDYELLFTIAPQHASRAIALGAELDLSVASIGVIQEGSGAVMLRDRDGCTRPILVRGYDHFCRC